MPRFTETIRLGNNVTVEIENDTLEATLKEASDLRNFAQRVKGADLQHRMGSDDNDYFEAVSRKRPEEGYTRTIRKIGKEQKGEKRLFCAADEPYVRYNKEQERQEVSFDFLTDKLRDQGFKDETATRGKFVPAERVQLPKSQGGGWSWRPL